MICDAKTEGYPLTVWIITIMCGRMRRKLNGRQRIPPMKIQADQSDLNLHDALVQKGWCLLKKSALLNGHPSAKIGWLKKWRLKRAMQIYVEALKIVPDSIGSKWALGKIYQALGDHTVS